MTALEKRHRLTTHDGTTAVVGTIGEWMQAHNVSRRTATRDIQALERLGYADRERHEAPNSFGFTWVVTIYPPHP